MGVAVVLTFLDVVLATIIGILLKSKKRETPLILTVSTALLGSLLSVAMIMGERSGLLYWFMTAYYITHPWFYFFIVWYEYDLLQTKKFVFYKFPSFYISLVLSLMPFANIGSHNIFIVTRRTFLGMLTFMSEPAHYLYRIYINLCIVSIGIVIGTLVWLSRKTALIYKSRVYGMLIAQGIYFFLEICYLLFSWPEWIIGLLMAPLVSGAAYYTIKYTPSTFKSWALSNFADNINDGFILYDEKDKLTYVNHRMSMVLNSDLLESFKDRKEFLKWSQDRETVNGFSVKRMVPYINNSGESELFFDIYEHELSDEKAYIGVFYDMKDMTSIIKRVEELNELNEQLEQVAKMKSDFLANMSHEIRTPMNAVIGMAEMSLREDMTPVARDYIKQIQSSGHALLTIINDILDFSKIESGKMDISLAEYAPMSLAQDEAGIILTRIAKKKVELIIDIDPMLPCHVMGDSIRIKQVITNLTNNAVKFTEEGSVTLKIGFKRVDDRTIILLVSVTDTGIGIKAENLPKLFQSFNQLDSKRNRNVEGTGLGLAISKQLVELMDGKIEVQSEYGKGSTFKFEVPQIVFDNKPSVAVKNADNTGAVILTTNRYVEDGLVRDIERLGIRVKVVGCAAELLESMTEVFSFAFVGEREWTDEIRSFAKANSKYTFVMLVSEVNHKNKLLKNMIELRKPYYTLNLGAVFNHEDLYSTMDKDDNFAIDFVAPDAKVLLVDDNEINLTVAEGLIQPLRMTVEKAMSGQEAIEKIEKKHYDLIFMDHMMPGMDGVETTRIIRRMYPDYDVVPIIALTANAMEETKAMFLVEGMNDFVAKPIEVAVIIKKIKQWLPDEKIIPEDNVIDGRNTGELEAEDKLIMDGLKEIDNLEIENAVKLLGGEKLYLKVVRDYYNVVDKKTESIRHALSKEDYHTFRIDVHSLKSSSKQMGAIKLSKAAEKLETAASEKNLEYIDANVEDFLRMYHEMKEKLAPLFKEAEVDDSTLPEIDKLDLFYIFDTMLEALDNLDMDVMETEYSKLSEHRFDSDEKELLYKLKNSIDEFDTDSCVNALSAWREIRNRK